MHFINSRITYLFNVTQVNSIHFISPYNASCQSCVFALVPVVLWLSDLLLACAVSRLVYVQVVCCVVVVQLMTSMSLWMTPVSRMMEGHYVCPCSLKHTDTVSVWGNVSWWCWRVRYTDWLWTEWGEAHVHGVVSSWRSSRLYFRLLVYYRVIIL